MFNHYTGTKKNQKLRAIFNFVFKLKIKWKNDPRTVMAFPFEKSLVKG